MADYKLTEEQAKAVYTKDKNIIVSAQAGAGKTDILVRRIILKLRGIESKDINNLEDSAYLTGIKSDIDDFIIVTFTNKAAQEMKDRIKIQLSKEIEKENNISEKRFLIEQLNKVTNAQISTMHSFCINIIRAYFQKLDINPQFKILNQATLKVLSWEAMDQTFLEFYEKEDEEFFSFLFEYSGLKDDENVKSMLFDIYYFIMSQIDPFAWLDDAKNKFMIDEDISSQEFKDKKFDQYISLLKDELLDKYKEAKLQIDNIIRYCDNSELPEFVYNFIDEEKNILDLIKKYLFSDDYKALIEFLENLSFTRMKSIPKKQKDLYDLEVFDLYKEKRNNLKDIIYEIRDLMSFDLEENIQAEIKQYKFISIIQKLLISFDTLFKEKKQAKEGIDFSDVEHLMVELLKDESVVYELKEKYKYIFFDEYQDANQVQNWIVERIKRKTNLFFVGDIKQSIYKFRLADPSIFNERYNRYKLSDNPYDMAVELSKNFRSRPEILDFNNFIFDELMTEDLGEINYKDPAHRLNAGNPNKKEDDKIASLTPVEINYIISDDLSFEEKSEDLQYDEKRENNLLKLKEESNQPYLIAKKIHSMIDEGYDAKSFGILLRNKQMIPEICEYLELFDIPYYTDSTEISYSDLEVSEFINILKAIDNDKKDLVLLSALVSVIGRMTESDLAIIRNSEEDKSFYNSFYSYEYRDDANEEILKKIESYKKKLEKYRNIEKTMSLYDFAWYVLIDSGFMTYLLSTFNGKSKLDNVIAFIEEIKDYQQAAQPGLFNFLNHVDRLIEKSSGDLEPGAELSEEDNVVRIMTIHKSKGLQIDNVILANTEKRFNKRDLYGQIIYHNDKKMALKTYNPYEDKYDSNLFFDEISRTKELELLSEEIRLQYVALTRAKNQLIIFSEIKDNFFEKLSDNYKKMQSPIEWISSVVLKDKISEGFKKDKLIDIESITDNLRNSKLKIDFNLYQKSIIISEKAKFLDIDINESKSLYDKDVKVKDETPTLIEDKFSKYFEFLDRQYDFKDQTKVSLKKTVSEISLQNDKKDQDFKNYERLYDDKQIDLDFDKPEFMLDEKLITPADRGIATHFAFQILPIKPYDKETLENELDRLVFEAKISLEEKDLIDKNSIIYFYNSDLGKRVLNARKVYREEAFTMKYKDEDKEDILVDGQIDLFFEEDNEFVIIDFKTGYMRENPVYKNQLDLYERGLTQATGKKVKEKYIYWTRNNIYVSY